MAMVKLRGFIYDLGGEVVESMPGMIKVRVPDRQELDLHADGLLEVRAQGPELALQLGRRFVGNRRDLELVGARQSGTEEEGQPDDVLCVH